MRSTPARQVRIIGGTWRRSKLPVAERPGLRPTPDRVRETLFNWLGQDLRGLRCLDAFAGSGALGFEAASRGAAQVVMLERDPEIARRLNAMRERLGARQVRVEVADALAWMQGSEPAAFDVVFIDPPFDADLHAPALDAARRLVDPQGLIYLEAAQPVDDATLERHALRRHRAGRAGAVYFHLLAARPGG